MYYHVQSSSSGSDVQRIYPGTTLVHAYGRSELISFLDAYTPKIVGMLWSFLAQEQTWFGNQPWASYGIQVLRSVFNVTFRCVKCDVIYVSVDAGNSVG